MSSDKEKRREPAPESEWLANIHEFLSETDDLSDTEVIEALRAEGIDPGELVKNGMTFLEQQRTLATNRMLAEARSKQKQMLEGLEVAKRSPGTLGELKAMIRAKLEAWAVAGSPQVSFAFRNLDAQTEEDLRTLLADIERLERLSAEDHQ